MSSSSEMMDVPVNSIFATDDEGTDIRKKREHSPYSQTDKKQKPNYKGEPTACDCGCSIIIPREAGRFTDCMCGLYYARWKCENLISTKSDKSATCEKCSEVFTNCRTVIMLDTYL